MANITDVAAAARVTVGTVSRVLNEDPTVRVRPETRARIVAAAKAVNYTPNYAARALRRSRVGALGLAVHDLSSPTYAAVIGGAQRAVARSGQILMLAEVDELSRDADALRRLAHSGAIDGLMVLPAGTHEDEVVVDGVRELLPVVVVNDRLGEASSVTLDDAAAARLATRHLVGLGHRRIGLLALDGVGVRAAAREAGWRDVLVESGCAPDERWVVEGGHTIESGREGMARLLAAGAPPSAVVVANTVAAIGAMGTARRAGLRIPEDLSVVGFHDVPLAEELYPPLTVVRLPLDRLGEAAVELLGRQLETATVEHVVVTEPEPALVVRASTAPPGA